MCPDTVTVCFETDYILGNSGHVAVIGSLEELGSWDPTKCVMATVIAGTSHWRACVSLPRKMSFTWKWIIVSPDRSKVWRWEERENRDSYSGIINGRWTAPWNGTARFTPERADDEKTEKPPEQEMPLHIIPPAVPLLERLRRRLCTIL